MAASVAHFDEIAHGFRQNRCRDVVFGKNNRSDRLAEPLIAQMSHLLAFGKEPMPLNAQSFGC